MIAIGCDHAGYELKLKVIDFFKQEGILFHDFGTDSTLSCDYPIYAKKVAEAVISGESDLGVLICGTGIGMSMAANKVRGIRAACCSDPYSARLTRMHNNANILCIGARVVGEGAAIDIIDEFVNTEFEGGKHQRRVDMITDLEKCL